jgi:hypothetical protein
MEAGTTDRTDDGTDPAMPTAMAQPTHTNLTQMGTPTVPNSGKTAMTASVKTTDPEMPNPGKAIPVTVR